MITIAIRQLETALSIGHQLHEMLSPIYNEVSVVSYDGDLEDLDIYHSGKADIIIECLSNLDFNFLHDYCLSALSQRLEIEPKLFIKKSSFNKHTNLGIDLNAKIAIPSETFIHPLQSINASWQYILSHEKNMTEADAIIMLPNQFIDLDLDLYYVKHLSPKEFVPMAGSGCIAMLCKSQNNTIRRLLAKLHDTNTAYCTNVERLIKKSLMELRLKKFGVYCYEDSNLFYHCYCQLVDENDNHFQTRVSQTTVFELDKAVLKNIQNLLHK